jgi:hypothetical protein
MEFVCEEFSSRVQQLTISQKMYARLRSSNLSLAIDYAYLNLNKILTFETVQNTAEYSFSVLRIHTISHRGQSRQQ